MTRVLNLLFRTSPYWGLIAAGIVLVLLAGIWLAFEHFSQRSQLRVRARASVFTAFVVLDVMLLVVLGSLHTTRVDVTRDKLYSLSDSTRRLAAGLDDTLTVEVFFGEDVPPDLVAFRESMVDLLDEFTQAAGGNIVVRFLEPNDAGVVSRAEALGIQPAPFVVSEAGSPVTKMILRGAAFTYKGRTETIPVIDRDVGLEYQIAKLIRVLAGTPRKVGILIGHKEMEDSLQQPQVLDTIRSAVPYYDLILVNLEGGLKPVPEDIRALIVTVPGDPIPEAELYRLDQFVMGGGALAFLGNGFSVIQPPPQMRMMQQMQMPEINPLDEGLAKLLEHFGLIVGDDVVLDDDLENGVRQRVTGLEMTRTGAVRPQYSKITHVFWTQEVDADTPLGSGVKNPLVYQSSTVEFTEAMRGRSDAVLMTPIRSPETSWVGTSSDVMFPLALGAESPQEPPELPDTATDEDRRRASRFPRPVMAALEAQVESAFAGKPVPAPATSENRRDRSETPVRIAAFGSVVPLIPEAIKGGLAGSPMLRDMPTLLANLVDWQLADPDLLQVRGKTAEPPRFREKPSGSEQTRWQWLLILGWPMVLAAVGLGIAYLVRTYRTAPATAGGGGGADTRRSARGRR
jgi:hypothetical protein